MNATIRALQARKAQGIAAMRAITTKASGESRDMNEAEGVEFDALQAALVQTETALGREMSLALSEAQLGVAVRDGAVITTSDNRAADPTLGFKSFGDFAKAVRNAGSHGGQVDARFAVAPTSFGNESAGADGGFLVPPEYSTDIFNLSLTEDSLLPYTDGVEIGSNSMVFPKDETTPWGTDGVRAYWQAEASAAQQTKPKFGTATLRLAKLMALAPVTDELLADATALTSYLPPLFGRSIRWKTNEAILYGTGAGQPIGALTANGPSVTIAKEAGQATNTIATANILNMIARLPPGSFPKAQWLVTPDALPAIFGLTLGSYPIYLPMNSGIQGSPYGTLMGRPINVSQHAAAFSSAGDIQLHDLSYYRTITKAGGIDIQSSMHLYFDADATAFRAVFRVDGQPKIVAPIAQAKGVNLLSPFIQLGAR